MDETYDPLKCNEDLPSSPGCHMDYGKLTGCIFKECLPLYMFIIVLLISQDDMPELQEVEEDQRSPGLFQVGAGVSHQELNCSPSTNWLAELANIATSPQSPLLKDVPHKRSV